MTSRPVELRSRSIPLQSLVAVVALISVIAGVGFLGRNWSTTPGSGAADPRVAAANPSLSQSQGPSDTARPPASTPDTEPGSIWHGGVWGNREPVDAQHGWVWRDMSDLVVTADGGGTWREATPPGLASTSADPYFIDAGHGWLLGRDQSMGLLLWRTSNQGKTWQSIRLRSAAEAGNDLAGSVGMNFISPSVGFLAMSREHGAISATTGGLDIYRTDDGGATIARVGGLTIAPEQETISLTFCNENDGLLMSNGRFGGSVYATHDGGVTWTALPLPTTDFPADEWRLTYRAEHAYRSDVWISALAVNVDSFAAEPILLTSHDAGRTWQQINYPHQADGFMPDPAGQFSVFGPNGVSVLETDGQRYAIKTSTDGGRTWTTATPSIPVGARLDRWNTTDGTNGWANLWLKCFLDGNANPAACPSDSFGRYGLVRTHDGGRTWTVIVPYSS